MRAPRGVGTHLPPVSALSGGGDQGRSEFRVLGDAQLVEKAKVVDVPVLCVHRMMLGAGPVELALGFPFSAVPLVVQIIGNRSVHGAWPWAEH